METMCKGLARVSQQPRQEVIKIEYESKVVD